MGKRRLAYEIGKHREGYYVLFVIAANGDMVGLYNNPGRGFLLSGNTFTTIDVPGSTGMGAITISPQGDIVGSHGAAGVSLASGAATR